MYNCCFCFLDSEKPRAHTVGNNVKEQCVLEAPRGARSACGLEHGLRGLSRARERPAAITAHIGASERAGPLRATMRQRASVERAATSAALRVLRVRAARPPLAMKVMHGSSHYADLDSGNRTIAEPSEE